MDQGYLITVSLIKVSDKGRNYMELLSETVWSGDEDFRGTLNYRTVLGLLKQEGYEAAESKSRVGTRVLSAEEAAKKFEDTLL